MEFETRPRAEPNKLTELGELLVGDVVGGLYSTIRSLEPRAEPRGRTKPFEYGLEPRPEYAMAHEKEQ